MVLLYEHDYRIDFTWRNNSERYYHLDVPEFEPTGGFLLKTPDVVREASLLPNARQMTISDYYDLAVKNQETMHLLYSQMKNNPDFQSDAYMRAYGVKGEVTKDSMHAISTQAYYFYVNDLYDQLIIDKIDKLSEKGIIFKDDNMFDNQSVIEANLCKPCDITWERPELREFFQSVVYHGDREYMLTKDDDEFVKDGYVYHTKNHLGIMLNQMDGIIKSYKPAPDGVTFEQEKRSINKIYYDAKEQPVFDPKEVTRKMESPKMQETIKSGLHLVDVDYDMFDF